MQLLICLLLVHTSYISLSLFMFIGRRIGGKFFIMSYAYILYPLPSLMLHTSTFLTVLLAWHRFCAADSPLVSSARFGEISTLGKKYQNIYKTTQF
jgi:hypothetical protein